MLNSGFERGHRVLQDHRDLRAADVPHLARAELGRQVARRRSRSSRRRCAPPAGNRPTIDRHVVVLPQPDSPTMPSVSPASQGEADAVDRLDDALAAKRDVLGLQAGDLQQRRHTGPLQVAQLRIETDAQPVAEQLGRQHDQQDAETGKDGQPPVADHQHRAALGQHRAPGRLRRRHADAEEGQRRLGDDDDADRAGWPAPSPSSARSARCGAG